MNEENRINALELIERMANEERLLAESTFLAPIVGGARVRVRVQGIVYELKVFDKFEGWALLRITEPGRAEVIEKAQPAIVGKYLKLFPRIRLILLGQYESCWWALAANTSDTRIQLTGPVPVHLVASAARFETISARFDGSVFWFESVDRRRDPAVARKLNEALDNKIAPRQLFCRGMVPQERLAYKMLFIEQNKEEATAPDDRTRISTALNHAGAQLDRFWLQNSDQAVVRFVLDGQTHNVVVRPHDMSVVSAGICLSGRDRDFDLTSLVGVFREYAEIRY